MSVDGLAHIISARWEASDIHIQPGANDLIIRFRMDGILRTVARLPKDSVSGVTSRIKVLGEAGSCAVTASSLKGLLAVVKVPSVSASCTKGSSDTRNRGC